MNDYLQFLLPFPSKYNIHMCICYFIFIFYCDSEEFFFWLQSKIPFDEMCKKW